MSVLPENDNRDEVNFLTAIFDTSFSVFVTEKLIKVFYIILIIGILIGIGVMVLGSFLNNGLWVGLLTMLFSPILFIVLLIIVRVMLEFVVVVFRIADYTRKISDTVTK